MRNMFYFMMLCRQVSALAITVVSLIFLSACSSSGTAPIALLPPLSPAQAAADLTNVANAAGTLVSTFGTKFTATQLASINKDIASLKGVAASLSGAVPISGTAAQEAVTAANDLLAIASNPLVIALVPAPDQAIYTSVVVALQLGAPLVEREANSLLVASGQPPILAPAAS